MHYKHIIFDFDSTLVAIEGIDELARMQGVFDEVSSLTAKAMDGELPFETIFQKRLDLIKPTEKHLADLAILYRVNLVEGVADLIRDLLALNMPVHIITGGYYQAVLPVTRELGIEDKNVHAVKLGPNHIAHTMVIENAILTKTYGKLKKLKSLNLTGRIAFVGDSMTDASVKSSSIDFIGYGGVIARSQVAKIADYYSDSANIYSLYNHLTRKEG